MAWSSGAAARRNAIVTAATSWAGTDDGIIHVIKVMAQPASMASANAWNPYPTSG